MKQVSKASQLNKSVKQVSLASQVKQVGLASQVSNLPKSSQESEIKKVLVKQVQVKQVKSSKFKLSNLNQASEVMLDRDTAPRKRPSTRGQHTLGKWERPQPRSPQNRVYYRAPSEKALIEVVELF